MLFCTAHCHSHFIFLITINPTILKWLSTSIFACIVIQPSFVLFRTYFTDSLSFAQPIIMFRFLASHIHTTIASSPRIYTLAHCLFCITREYTHLHSNLGGGVRSSGDTDNVVNAAERIKAEGCDIIGSDCRTEMFLHSFELLAHDLHEIEKVKVIWINGNMGAIVGAGSTCIRITVSPVPDFISQTLYWFVSWWLWRHWQRKLTTEIMNGSSLGMITVRLDGNDLVVIVLGGIWL